MNFRIALLAATAVIVSSCAVYTLAPAQTRQVIANNFSVQPSKAWNVNSRANEPNLRAWTMDGPMLNTLGFIPGLESGASMLKTPSGKEPMPVFRSSMGAPEVAELFEATLIRASEKGAMVKVTNVRPSPFAGKPGFRFDFTYVNQADDVDRRGIAAGAIVSGKLYLIFFHGARIHYFPSNVEEVEAIIRSAQIG
jgi:hypothetical protein